MTPKGPARRRDIPSAESPEDLGHLASGSATSELRALCEHVALYAGFPRALDALTVVDDVAGQAGLAPPPQLRRIRLGDHETVVAQAGRPGRQSCWSTPTVY